jgi:hypothetical protein
MVVSDEAQKVIEKYNNIKGSLNEKTSRLWLANESIEKGTSVIMKTRLISSATLSSGRKQIMNKDDIIDSDRIRKAGAGRPQIIDIYPEFESKLLKIVDSTTYGNPEESIKWKNKSLYNIKKELEKDSIFVSVNTISKYLKKRL